MVALLNTGLVVSVRDAPAHARSTGSSPASATSTIETTIKNTSTGAHPFPYLDPTQLDNLLGCNIPNIPNIQLSAAARPVAADRRRAEPVRAGLARLQRAVLDRGQLQDRRRLSRVPRPASIDYLASRGPGVSYGLAITDSPDNYVDEYATGYPGQDVTAHSMLLPFSTRA